MNLLKVTAVSLILCLISFDCSDELQKPVVKEAQALIYQLPGCQSTLLRSTSGSSDSCFSYTFDDSLVVTLCVRANCCPDSARFSFSKQILSDVVKIEVVDTAANLCRCMCLYKIHAMFRDLSSEKYQFHCFYNGKLAYNETVYKRKPS